MAIVQPAQNDSAAVETVAARLRTTIHCYSLFDIFFPSCGLLDYTEGIYNHDPTTPYQVAQRRQIDYVLDEVQCWKGMRVLDIGCGNGTVLKAIRERGADGVGITISSEQVALCRACGLDARQIDYKDLGQEFRGQFDGVVANGPVEHFVQPSEAAECKADKIYRGFFRICHEVIDPHSTNRRMINTTIHFVRRPEPEKLLKSPFAFRWFSDEFHYAFLARSFGGWYPVQGQLEECAQSYFQLAKSIDGTEDYHLTSEEWLARIRSALLSCKALSLFGRSVPFALRHPKQFVTMMTCMLLTQSWNWQFRTQDPPTRLVRQTWQYVD